MTKPLPVKLTDEQFEQLEELVRRTGLDRSKILRAAYGYFLQQFADKPMEVLRVYAEQAERQSAQVPDPDKSAIEQIEQAERRELGKLKSKAKGRPSQ